MKSLLNISLLAMAFAFACPAQNRQATLTWQDTVNPPATTYNAYRAPTACNVTSTFGKINTQPITAKTYVDTAIPAGKSCYYVTAVLDGLESPPSNKADGSVGPLSPTGLILNVTTN